MKCTWCFVRGKSQSLVSLHLFVVSNICKTGSYSSNKETFDCLPVGCGHCRSFSQIENKNRKRVINVSCMIFIHIHLFQNHFSVGPFKTYGFKYVNYDLILFTKLLLSCFWGTLTVPCMSYIAHIFVRPFISLMMLSKVTVSFSSPNETGSFELNPFSVTLITKLHVT